MGNYYVHASDIVGYTYQAENHCPGCTEGFFQHLANSRPADTETVLDNAAQKLGVDRYDERSYDSGDFPKVIFASMVEGEEHCGSCGEVL